MDKALQEHLRASCRQQSASCRQDPLDLTGADLSFLDLRNLDLQRVNLTRANLAHVLLGGTSLQGAILAEARFTGVSLAELLSAGIPPEDLLHHRGQADRREFVPLHFGPHISIRTPLQLTPEECLAVCSTLRKCSWEDLVDTVVFSCLYPDQPWSEWVVRCRSRAILDWALAHRTGVSSFLDDVPLYGRVLPSTLIEEVEPSDLVEGLQTTPNRVFHRLGIRHIIRQSDLKGEDVPYLLSPFGNGNGVVQITSRQELQLEGGLMHQSVADYDEPCLSGECFIYHVGPRVLFGSTLELSAQGYVIQHVAIDGGVPSQQDRDLLSAWLEERGLDQEKAPLMEQICTKLRQAGVVEVNFQIYWYGDEDTIDSVDALDAQGNSVVVEGVSDSDLWRLVGEESGSDTNGRWQLSVREKRLQYTGEVTPPEDDDDYSDEPGDYNDESWDGEEDDA